MEPPRPRDGSTRSVKGAKMQQAEGKSRVGVVNLEKRKHPRFRVDLPMEYSHVESSSSGQSRAVNASEGGLLVHLPEPVRVGQQLKIKLFFSGGTGLTAIHLLAEVVWIDIHLGEGWGDYRCGVRFTDISEDDLGQLKRFLRGLSE
jgi:hypothetical protein